MEKARQEEDRGLQAEKIISFLRRIGAYDFFKKIKQDNELTEEISFEEYQKFLLRINGIARNILPARRKFDGEGVILEGFSGEAVVPRQEDKEILLAKSFNARTKLQYPDDDAYMLPAILTAVHPFLDGNGRTSRVLHSLLTQYPSEEDFELALRSTLGEDGRFDSPDINPSYLNKDIIEILWAKSGLPAEKLPNNLTRLRTGEQVTSEKSRKFSRIFDVDGRYCFIAMYSYLNSIEKLDVVLKTKSDFPNLKIDDYKAISLNKMEEIFTNDDWDNLLNEYYKIKKLSIEVLIEIFIEPDKYLIPGTNSTLRDKFINAVNENLARNQII